MRMVWGVLPQASPLTNGEGKGLYSDFLRTCRSERSLGVLPLSLMGQARPLAIGRYSVTTDGRSRWAVTGTRPYLSACPIQGRSTQVLLVR